MENSIMNQMGIDPGYLILGLAVITLILFITVIICLIKMSQLYRRYDLFMRGKDAETLEDLLIKQIEDIDAKKKAEAEEQERIAHRKAKYTERQAKRKAKRRQEQIDIQSAAFLKAMLDYDDAMDAADLYTEYAPDKNVENTETE